MTRMFLREGWRAREMMGFISSPRVNFWLARGFMGRIYKFGHVAKDLMRSVLSIKDDDLT